MEDEVITLRHALYPNFWVLRLLGYWPPTRTSKIVKFLYLIYAIPCVGFWFGGSLVSEIINIVLSFGSLEKLVAALFLFLTHMAQFIKLCFFTANHARIDNLLKSLQRNIFKPRDDVQYEIITRYVRNTKYIYYTFMSMAGATCICWGIFPVIERGEDNRMPLPLAGYYPFSTDSSPVFELIFSYQIIATTINAATNVSMDTVASGLLALMCAELDVLNNTVANIKHFAIEALKSRPNYQEKNKERMRRNEYELIDEELQEEMTRTLVRCIHHHWNILSTANEISKLFNWCVLSQFVAGSIIICLTMFELTLVPIFSVKFLSMVLYQGCMLIEIIIYCWFGNEMILKSARLSYTVYSSDWTSCSMSYKKNILNMMTRAQVPIKMYAGNFFTLSLETLINILRSSWSYFAVLNRVHQD